MWNEFVCDWIVHNPQISHDKFLTLSSFTVNIMLSQDLSNMTAIPMVMVTFYLKC